LEKLKRSAICIVGSKRAQWRNEQMDMRREQNTDNARRWEEEKNRAEMAGCSGS
jgi:hypothetical protein